MEGRCRTISRRSALKQIGAVGTLSLAGCFDTDQTNLPGSLSVEWVTDTTTEYDGNHHAMATATVDGQPMVAIPLNDFDESDQCGIVTIDAAGNEQWRERLDPEDCTPHAVGDIGVGDLDTDDRPEFLAATETRDVFAFDAETGEVIFQEDLLESIGYSAPTIGDLTGDGQPDVIVVDFERSLSVVRQDGTVVWTEELDGSVWKGPFVTDFTGDGHLDVAVNHGRRAGEVVLFNAAGDVHWRTDLEGPSLTWTVVDRDRSPGIVVATRNGYVERLDGATGDIEWSSEIADRVAVGATDGDHVYASAKDGAVRGITLEEGTERWTTQVSDDEVRMPGLAVGAITERDAPAIVAATYDGRIGVCDAESGDLLVRREFDVGFYTPPVTTDITGNGRDEILVLHGDGRVAALSYEAET